MKETQQVDQFVLDIQCSRFATRTCSVNSFAQKDPNDAGLPLHTCPLDYNFDAGAAFPTVVISLYSNLQMVCQYKH